MTGKESTPGLCAGPRVLAEDLKGRLVLELQRNQRLHGSPSSADVCAEKADGTNHAKHFAVVACQERRKSETCRVSKGLNGSLVACPGVLVSRIDVDLPRPQRARPQEQTTYRTSTTFRLACNDTPHNRVAASTPWHAQQITNQTRTTK